MGIFSTKKINKLDCLYSKNNKMINYTIFLFVYSSLLFMIIKMYSFQLDEHSMINLKKKRLYLNQSL